jgi:hypothetical protein
LKAGYLLSRLGRVLVLSGEGPALICSRSPGHTPSPSGAKDTDLPAGQHPKTEHLEKSSSSIPDGGFQEVLWFSSPYRLFYVRNIPLINIFQSILQRFGCLPAQVMMIPGTKAFARRPCGRHGSRCTR